MRRAVVVGAGLGGLATAVGLHRGGWRVTVLERWPYVKQVGTALGLWPEAQVALEALGLDDAVHAVGVPYRQGTVRSPDGRRLADLPLAGIERRGGRPVLLVARSTLLRVLLDALPDLDLRTSVVDLDVPALRREHDLVVGADGLGSVVRASAFGVRTRPRYAGFVAWRGYVDAESGPYGEIWGRGLMAGVTAMAPGQTNWYLAVPGPPAGGSFEEARSLVAAWPTPLPALVDATPPDRVLRHAVHDLAPRLRTYVDANLALVGDAAHAMTPTLGQGGCQALIDAAALVGHVARGDDVPSGLHAYDRERRRRTQRLAARSAMGARLSLGRHTAPLRNALVRAGALVSA